MKYNQSGKNVITWTSDRMGLKMSGAVVLQFIPIIGVALWGPLFYVMYLITPISVICCLYEMIYLSKCRISFEKKTVIIKRPLHGDVEYPLCELMWSASINFTFKGCTIYLYKGKQKMMKITDGWDNYDILMTFPHLHPNRFIELELIRRRNERLRMERQYKGLNL